ncbi:hypothetical protein WJ0W_001438 [Paenibacillus melissococcoides]|uniref:Uncharacterized protein n=1 Tax=Paenibacillus melissococcoides TaxID=2912268 RepID=A0ABN8TZG8_9BACL|nr:hypothetical protein WJ0W_001438 [Paenibacillus melissococcoides]
MAGDIAGGDAADNGDNARKQAVLTGRRSVAPPMPSHSRSRDNQRCAVPLAETVIQHQNAWMPGSISGSAFVSAGNAKLERRRRSAMAGTREVPGKFLNKKRCYFLIMIIEQCEQLFYNYTYNSLF